MDERVEMAVSELYSQLAPLSRICASCALGRLLFPPVQGLVTGSSDKE